MSKTVQKSKRSTAITTTSIRASDLPRLKQMADGYRLANVEMIGALLDAWDSLSVEQQVQVIRRQSEEEAAGRREEAAK